MAHAPIWSDMSETEKKTGRDDILMWFWRIIAPTDLEYRQMKVCDYVHFLPYPTT